MTPAPLLGSDVTWPDLERRGGRIIVSFLRHRLTRDTGTIVILVGSPGTGKSFSALEIARELDPSFGIDRVVFDVRDYLRFLSGGTSSGQAVLLDEAGVSAPSRRWRSEKNIALSLTVESVRHRGLLTLVTVPDATMVDVNVRKLAFLMLNCRKVDRVRKEVIARPYIIKTNFVDGTVYMSNPVTRILIDPAHPERGGEAVKWRTVRFGRPPLDLETAYLAKRAAYMDSMYKTLADSLSDDTEPKKPEPKKDMRRRENRPPGAWANRKRVPDGSRFAK